MCVCGCGTAVVRECTAELKAAFHVTYGEQRTSEILKLTSVLQSMMGTIGQLLGERSLCF